MTEEFTRKRTNEILHCYWDELRGTRAFPLENEVDPDAIESIWKSCFLVRTNLAESNGSFKYTYLGEELVAAYGDDLSNKEICEKLIYPSNMSLVHKFNEVKNQEKPAIEESEFINSQNMLIKSRSVMLPLGHRGENGVGYVLGGMTWKAF